MQRLLFRSSSFLLAGALSIFATAACGGDDDDDAADDGDDADDGTDDGDDDDGGDAPDAGAPDAAPIISRAGTIAITETTITNTLDDPDVIRDVRGAIASIAFIDEQTITVPPVKGFEDPVGGCQIFRYNVPADQQPNQVDEGAITVSGTANGEFTCAYVEGDYRCQSTTPAVAGGSLAGATLVSDGGFGVLTVKGATFPDEMVGMTVVLSGFANEALNNVPVQVVDVFGGDVLEIFGLPNVNIVGDADSAFVSFVGLQPTPSLPEQPVFNFLDEGLVNVTIAKADTELVPEFDVVARARGEGFTLAGAQPHEFPFAAADLTFACAKDGCGADPDQAGALLGVLVINGETTDVLPPPEEDDGVTMLPAETSYVTFTCAVIGQDTITIPSAGITEILMSNPARVQMTVGRFAASIQQGADAETSTNVLVGHSLTGFTTVPPAKAKPSKK